MGKTILLLFVLNLNLINLYSQQLYLSDLDLENELNYKHCQIIYLTKFKIKEKTYQIKFDTINYYFQPNLEKRLLSYITSNGVSGYFNQFEEFTKDIILTLSDNSLFLTSLLPIKFTNYHSNIYQSVLIFDKYGNLYTISPHSIWICVVRLQDFKENSIAIHRHNRIESRISTYPLRGNKAENGPTLYPTAYCVNIDTNLINNKYSVYNFEYRYNENQHDWEERINFLEHASNYWLSYSPCIGFYSFFQFLGDGEFFHSQIFSIDNYLLSELPDNYFKDIYFNCD